MLRRCNIKPITDIEKLEIAQYPLVYTTWNGNQAFVKCRMLTPIQIQSCGDFSLIKTEQDKLNNDRKLTTQELTEYACIMHKIVEASLVSPTYEQIMSMAQANTLWEKSKKELDELTELCKSIPLNDNRRKRAEDEISKKRIWVDLILPEDFMSYIFCYALNLNKSDIAKVGEKILIDAAILADRWGKTPSYYVKGMFTEFNTIDIDRRAMIELHNFREAQKGKQAD
jgi:hypothetical protein